MTEPASIPGGLRRFRIDLAYDGTDFSGWAIQPGLRTVEGDLVKALEVIFGKLENGLRVAGRTDAGVHAIAQVLHVDLTPIQARRIKSGLPKRLNAMLPRDVRIHKVELAAEGFHARFSATSREYRYRINQSAIENPLIGRYQLWHKYPLDASKMHDAGQHLLGLHDFASFCKRRAGSTTIREMKKLRVSEAKGEIVIDLEADAFCHNQVRSIVGALVAIGENTLSLKQLLAILDQKKRVGKFKVVGAEGLTLMKVNYPKDHLLAKQAEKTRNMRSLD
jgi:tRNA pseudouridine38-40 synthase